MKYTPCQGSISITEFFTGFFAALAASVTQQELALSCGERFDTAIAEAFTKFAKKSRDEGYRPDFLIGLHPIHGDSAVINQGFSAAVRRDIISFDNPSFQKFRVKLNPEEATELLDHIPGGPGLYIGLVDDFLQLYGDQRAIA